VSSTSRSGLGVSIVDAVAHGHAGTLRLRSQPKGLVAELCLPIG